MKISIAMCTYNGGRYLKQQLDSIARQTRQPNELVVCDDGSTDQTEQILAAFRSSVDFPVHLHRNSVNLGSSRNFEQAIRLCSGDVIALCDQDDVWFPEKLARMSEALRARPQAAGVFSNARLIDDNGTFLPKDLWQMVGFTSRRQKRFLGEKQAPYLLVESDTVTGAALMIRSSFVAPCLPISTDWIHDGWIAMILTVVAELLPLPDHLMSYRLHTTQQVGIGTIPLHKRFSSKKEKALVSHQSSVRRFTAMADKLEGVPGQNRLVAELRRKAIFYDRRAAILGKPRVARILPLLQSQPDYARYALNVVSMLRDLAH